MPIDRSTRTDASPNWTRWALRGAGIASINALLVSIVVLKEAIRTDNQSAIVRMALLVILLALAGACGGLAYGLALRRKLHYYAAWVIGAEAVLAAFALEALLLHWTVFRDSEPRSALESLSVLFGKPSAWLVAPVAAAIGGIIYGRLLRQQA